MERREKVRRNVATLAGFRAMRDNRWLGGLRTRRGRWMLIFVLFVGWAGSTTAIAVDARGFLPFGLAVLGSAVAWTLLALATRNVSSTVNDFADERDRALRDRANRIAYWIIGIPLAVVVGLIVSIDGRLGGVELGDALLPATTAIAWGFFVLYMSLPMVVLTVIEPDLPLE